MGRSPRAYLAFAAALGLSGCLLFTDPINKAPDVKIDKHSDPVVRGIPTKFTATVTDDKDNPAFLFLDWAEFNSQYQGCPEITAAAWVSANKSETLASSAPYIFTAQSLNVVCLCARATDHNGATGQYCLAVSPVNPTPVAKIVDVSGNPSGQARPLCTQIHLSAETSSFQAEDKPQFNWILQYSGNDSAGKLVQLTKCAGVATDKTDQHQCFYAAGPGTYTVTLSINDTVVLSGSTATSDPFTIPVSVDMPPCIQRTDPDVHAQRILLSRSTDLGGAYQSRTFKVLSVADDCEPYPLPAGSTNPSAQFVWSVLDSTQSSPAWAYQTNTSDSFTVSQALFPNARPGDTIKLRVEARDTLVQKLYQSGGQVCSSDTVDICCGTSACGTPNDCIRWTTWTVQFQP